MTLFFPASSRLFGLLLLTACLCVNVNNVAAKYCKLMCDRQPDIKHMGFDAVKDPIDIDLGACRENYTIDDDCELPESSLHTCTRNCQPRAYEVIPVNDRSNPRSVMVIKSCFAPRHKCLKQCVRKPNYVFLFTGSEYQEKVDVGKCVGQCGDDVNDTLVQCVPTRNISKAFQGPNGAVLQSVIDKCSCGNTNCYREDHYESYKELVTLSAVQNNSVVPSKVIDKLINVGRCSGSCPGVTIPGTCYPSDDNCLLYLNERPAKCVPTEGYVHKFSDPDNQRRHIPAIVSCGCDTG